MIKYIKRKLRTTTGLMMGVMITLSLVLGVSYSTFVITTDKYKASEMRISDLLYGINITNVENASINGTEVTIQSGKIGIVNVTITSLNEIDSKYSLEYKTKSGSGRVTYLGSSTYEPTGSINKNGTSVYTKTITLGIEATSTMKLEFNVSGGYTYNSTPTTLVGYTKVNQKAHKVKVTSTNTTYGGIGQEVQLINNGETAVISLFPNEGYEYASNTCGGTKTNGSEDIRITNVTSSKTCTVSFKVSNPFTNGTLANKIYADNPVVLERTDFSTTLGSDTPTNDTIYKASGEYTEDGSEVYYFAGNVSNNWVKFGKDKDNNDLYWRIIRTNIDGSVRLLYAGTSPSTTEGYIIVDSKSVFAYNEEDESPNGAGYMYGSTGSLANNRLNTNSSDAKIAIDTWYSKGINIKTDTSGNKYDKYVSRTAIYCNDRSGDSYESYEMYYAPYIRLMNGGFPTYRCGYNSAGGHWYDHEDEWITTPKGLYSDANVADKFSASTTKGGNGKLQYPVALITADEIAMAGWSRYGYYSLNSTGSSVTGDKRWWTMSPYDNWDNYTSIFIVDVGSRIGDLNAARAAGCYSEMVLRPVLSLKSCVTYKSGNGTSSSPYEVSIDSTCASKEN